jgi:aspartyl-tRNA(Asn)/glutamyl-tRNA(Gln) amidotransferase subunit A
MSDDLIWLGVAELGSAYRAGTVSPVDVTRACLARVARLDHQLDSFLKVTAERAMADALRAERELRSGHDRGPMHGVPYCLKDIVETAGIRTTGQSRSLANHIPTEDAFIEARLREGGGVLMGKTTTWEFAHGGPSWDVIAPPARNPWNTDRHPAGSSSGTGAAVAAGFAACGIGTDTGGSIRLPAAVCGIAGMKATYGRVSRRGVLPNSFSHDHAGPMARTSRDAAAMLTVIAGHDPRDPGSAARPSLDYAAALSGDCRGLTIGVPCRWLEEEAPLAPEVRAAFDASLAVMVDLGATLRDIELPSLDAYSDCKKTISMAELFAIHQRTLRETPELLGESLRWRIQCGALIRAEDVIQAMRMRAHLTAAMQAAFRDVDLIATPTTGPAGKLEPTPHDWLFTHKSLTTPFNSAGNPALSVLSGFDADGMPLSLQLAGRLFGEATCFRAGDAYERAAGWGVRRPQLHPQTTVATA